MRETLNAEKLLDMQRTLGGRIRTARVAAGMSPQTLSDELDWRAVTADDICRWEDGSRSPSDTQMRWLKEALGVDDWRYFHSCLWDTFERLIQEISVRIPDKRAEARLKMEIAKAFDDYSSLETWLDLPVGKWNRPDAAQFGGVNHPQAPERAALALRRHWGLGRGYIPSVVDAMERQSVKIIALPPPTKRRSPTLPPEIDALTAWGSGPGFSAIAVNANVSGDRRRFAAARELGRTLLTDDVANPASDAACERFARAFLHPASFAPTEIAAPARITPYAGNELVELKRRFDAAQIQWICDVLGVAADAPCARPPEKCFDVVKGKPFSVVNGMIYTPAWKMPLYPLPDEDPKRYYLLGLLALDLEIMTYSRALELGL